MDPAEVVMLPGRGVEIHPSRYKQNGYSCRKSSICIWITILIAMAGWAVAFTFLYFWMKAQAQKTLLEPFQSDAWMPRFHKFAVAADDGECSEIGRDTMKRGGNAIDAAIATLLCDGLKNYHSMGLGGGFFMTIYNSTLKKCFYIDAREVAPSAATPDVMGYGMEAKSKMSFGWKSIGVPGELMGYWEAYSRYGSGRVDWRDLWRAAIGMANEGFYVSNALGRSVDLIEKWRNISKEPTLSNLINPTTGALCKEGDLLRLPTLAKTMDVLANSADPVNEFYRGNMASRLVADIKNGGGIVTADDLINYKVEHGDAWEIKLKDGGRICTLPAPSGGPAVSFFLKLVDELNLQKYDPRTAQGLAMIYHYLIEALKFTYSEHFKIEDPKFGGILQVINDLKSDKYADMIRSKIGKGPKASGSSYTQQTKVEEEKGGTAHISLVDAHGNAVSATSSINYYLGSMKRSTSTGILLNNHLYDFQPPEEVEVRTKYRPNVIEPHKRPRSAMAPVIILDKGGKARLITGGSGGGHIIAAVAFVSARMIYLNETIKEATDAARIHLKLDPYETKYETYLPQEVVKLLKEMGHDISPMKKRRSVVQSVSIRPPYIYPFSDHRKGGYPAGY